MQRVNGDTSSSRAYRHSDRRSRQRRPPRTRPNFFVGLRITSRALVAQIEEFQRRIAQAFPDAASCLVDPRTLHVTLCVLHLEDTEGKLHPTLALRYAIQQASQLLYEVTPSLAERCFGADAAPELTFNGWWFFGQNDILIAPLDVTTEHGHGLSDFAEQLHACFDSCGATTEPFRRPYSPHVTIWKTSKDRDGIKRLNHARNTQRVPPAAFTDTVQNALFDLVMKHDDASLEGQEAALCGRDAPLSIELLAMGEREDDGYYKAYASVRLRHVHVESLESISSGQRVHAHAVSEL